jgi:DNA-directed RNA polymerase subunit beta
MAGYLNLVVSVPVLFDEGPESPSVVAFGSAIVTQSRVMEPARKSFGKIKHIVEIPNLIEMQRESYERFLQQEVDPDERVDKGLQGVFKGVFPIRDFSGTASLEFVRYSIGRVKYDVEECLQRGMTYEAPIKITVRLVVYDVDKDSGAKHIRDIKEQEVYFGTIPLMTNNGTGGG